jgi:hypothetical protein
MKAPLAIRSSYDNRYEALIDDLTPRQARLILYCMSDASRFIGLLKGFILNSLAVETMTEADVLFERGIA